MSETAQDRRSRRGGGRDARRQLRSNSTATVIPFIIRQLEPLDILNNESAEIIEDHVIICELKAYGISEISSIRISNSLLIEIIDDQVNIVNILANESRKTINLNKRIQDEHIVFITAPAKCE